MQRGSRARGQHVVDSSDNDDDVVEDAFTEPWITFVCNVRSQCVWKTNAFFVLPPLVPSLQRQRDE